MPETTENSVSTSEQFPEVVANDSKQALPRPKYVDVFTDTHKLKISLTDGSIVSAELLNYAKEFESTDSNVKLLNNSGQKYIAKTNVQSKDVVAPINYQTDVMSYEIGSNDFLEIVLNGETKDQVAIKKIYRFKRDSHLIEVEQIIQNLLPSTTAWRQYNSLERGDEEEGNVMLYTYTGAAYYDEEDKFNKIEYSDIRDANFLKETSHARNSMIQHYIYTA